MNTDNIKKDTESLENCSKFVQKFRDLLQSKNEFFKQSSIHNNYDSKRKKGFHIINKNKANLPVIKNYKIFNYSNDKKEKDSHKYKYRISPNKYLLNLESISDKKDTIFQFHKIRDYLLNVNKCNSKDDNNSKKEFKDTKFISQEKSLNNDNSNKKLGLTIYYNNKYNFNKFNINKKEKNEKNENIQKNNIEPKTKKIIIQSLTNMKNKNYSTKNFYIRNFNNDIDNNIKTNIFNNNKFIKSPSEIFKNELIKRQKHIKNCSEQLDKMKNSKTEKLFFNSTDNFKLQKRNIFKMKNSSVTLYPIKQATNIQTKNYYLVYPGNNGKLIKSCLLTRPNWEELPDDKKKHDCNLLWTPLAIQINFHFHKYLDNSQIVNHFVNQKELTNKRNTFINLLKYCELNAINLFSFYPLTIIIPLNNDNFYITLQNFKNCYYDLPNLIEDPKGKNENFLDKFYWDYFHVKSNSKIGNVQKLVIPKTHFTGKNLWLIKRINLNRGREIKVMSNLDEIIQEINQIKNKEYVKYIIIQKYIERPLLYCWRKFDIRIWVLFTYLAKAEKFEAYVFKEGHLKASSELFDINSLDLFIHLTNYSVQKNNKNFSKIEIGNEISFNDFQNELDKKEKNINFRKDIFTKIIKIIEITASVAKNRINGFDKNNCFEIFGYDFMLDDQYNPYLLEINTNPGYEESSPLIKMLVPRLIDDAFRLTIDKIFERNDKDKYFSKFKVEGYSDEENMWQKIKV